ncbi:MAG: MFS transporter [Gammaproteobacteria bacterium]|nr:MFS transporter [Gammaproteobacteria bacterium]MBQ0839218.1 MFS transporter [Gammaproteobacteria bacterium]
MCEPTAEESQANQPIKSDNGETVKISIPFPNQIYAWYVVIILMLAYTVSFIDRQILSLLVDPIRSDLKISDTEMSLLQGLSFAVFYTLMGLPLGRLADQRSRRGIITLGVLFWSVMTATCGFAKDYWQLFLARMGVGVGEAALSPSAYSIIADIIPPQRLSLAIGVYGIGVFLGAGLAMIIGGTIVGMVGETGSINFFLIGEIRSWQAVFILVSLPGLLIVALMATVKEPKRRGTIRTSVVNGVDKIQGVPVREVVAYLRANFRTVALHNLAVASLVIALYGGMAWIPTFFKRIHDFGPAEVGLKYGFIILIFGTLGVLFGSWSSDRMLAKGVRDAKIRTGMYSALGVILPSIAFPLIDNPSYALALIAIATFFMTFAFGAAPAALQEIMPNQMRGQASAIYLCVISLIGLSIGPTAIALITDYVYGYDEAIRYALAIVPAVAMGLAAILFALCLKPYKDSLDHLNEWSKYN